MIFIVHVRSFMKVFGGISLAWLAACGSPESYIRTYIKCGIAAEQLGHRKVSNVISEKFAVYVVEKLFPYF